MSRSATLIGFNGTAGPFAGISSTPESLAMGASLKVITIWEGAGPDAFAAGELVTKWAWASAAPAKARAAKAALTAAGMVESCLAMTGLSKGACSSYATASLIPREGSGAVMRNTRDQERWTMLDRELARLAAADRGGRLQDLEQAIWLRVERLKRLRRVERITSRVQLIGLGAVLIVSTAVGGAVAQAPRARPPVMQISALAADLAPSSLLGPAR